MPRKSTAPFKGPPSWLDPAAEVPLTRPDFPDRNTFVIACMSALLAQGLTVRQSAEVVANAAGESAWGSKSWNGNGGGWKITRAHADAFKRREGRSAPWWKARGNVDSEDSAWCFYRVFPTPGDFLREWCEHFVPKPDAAAPYPGYRAAGAAFWSGAPWFGHLIAAGYKGAPSKRRLADLRRRGRPEAEHPSIAAHDSIARDVIERWAQHHLAISVDGVWGRESRAALAVWQRSRGLPATGELDAATVATLVRR